MRAVNLEFVPEKGEIYYRGVSSALWERAIFSSFQKHLEESIGPSADRIVENLCKDMIKEYYFLYPEKTLEENDRKSTIKTALKKLSKFGYGKFKLIEGGGKPLVALENSFNIEAYDQPDKPICHAVKGILEGLFENLTARKCSVQELKCKALGEEKCEFKIEIGEEKVKRKIKKPTENKGKDLKLKLERGGLIYRKSPTCLVKREFSARLVRKFRKLMEEGARGVIYQANKRAARRALEKRPLKSFFFKNFLFLIRRKVESYIAQEMKERGYGKAKVTIKGDRIEMKVKNCHNCMGMEETDHSVCYNFQGIFSEIGEKAFENTKRCREPKCIAKGDDYCLFVVEKL